MIRSASSRCRQKNKKFSLRFRVGHSNGSNTFAQDSLQSGNESPFHTLWSLCYSAGLISIEFPLLYSFVDAVQACPDGVRTRTRTSIVENLQ